MEEQTLLKTSLISSVIGIVILFGITQFINPASFSITTEKGDEVNIQGIVEKITNIKGTTFLTLTTKQKTTVVLFENKTIPKGSHVKITGKVETYKGEKEIIGDEVIIS